MIRKIQRMNSALHAHSLASTYRNDSTTNENLQSASVTNNDDNRRARSLGEEGHLQELLWLEHLNSNVMIDIIINIVSVGGWLLEKSLFSFHITRSHNVVFLCNLKMASAIIKYARAHELP